MSILDPIQVAERLAVSRTTVYELLRRKELPHVRVGRQYRVTEAQLQEYLERSSVGVAIDADRQSPVKRDLRKLMAKHLY